MSAKGLLKALCFCQVSDYLVLRIRLQQSKKRTEVQTRLRMQKPKHHLLEYVKHSDQRHNCVLNLPSILQGKTGQQHHLHVEVLQT